MKKIFVAIDGSEHAWKALDYAAELAKGMNSTLFVYSALKPSDSGALLAMYDMDDPLLASEVSGLDDLGDKILAQAKDRLDPAIKAEFKYEVGYPPEMILAAAEKSGADTIVMGWVRAACPALKSCFWAASATTLCTMPKYRL